MHSKILSVVGFVLLAACQKTEAPSTSHSPITNAASAPSGVAVDGPTPQALPIAFDDANFVVNVTQPAPCAPKAPCVLRVAVEAKGAFHVNDEYPYKVVSDEANEKRGVHVTSTGTFAKEAPTKGAVTLPFTYDGPEAVVGGTFKFSVCAEEKCLIDTKKFAAKIAKP